MQKLAEHEIKIKGLWDQYSVRTLRFFSVEPLRGELPVRLRATHFLLSRQLTQPLASLEHPRDWLLRRRASSVGPDEESAAAQLEGTQRSDLQHRLESAEFSRVRGRFSAGPEPRRCFRNGLFRQCVSFSLVTCRNCESVGNPERHPCSPPDAVGSPESRLRSGVSPQR